MWNENLMEAANLLPDRLPKGHGKSFKKGVSDGIMGEDRFETDFPNGRDLSYAKGKTVGAHLKKLIASLDGKAAAA